MTIKLIAISDLHQGNPVSIPRNIRVVTQEKLINNLIDRKPDGILIAGDLQDYMWNLGVKTDEVPHIKKRLRNDGLFQALDSSSVPVYFIWGNTDVIDLEKESRYQETPVTDELREWFCDEFQNLTNCHNKIQSIKGLPIIGYDDANKTIDDHSGKCWDDETISKDLRPIIETLAQKDLQRTVLLTHTPPKGVLDFSSIGEKHIGSVFLCELIEEFQPLLSIFGHVHYCGGYSELIGKTQCINVSSFGLVISHDILFGQSAFELQIDSTYQVSSTKMIVSHYWEGNKKKAFTEYRHCEICGRHTPFARKRFKNCRVCLGERRIANKRNQFS